MGDGENKVKIMAEYIWVDGKEPTPELRSKTKILAVKEGTPLEKIETPVWGFDGSSTNQASGHDSDCVLKPVAHFYDPLRNEGSENVPHLLVLNQVYLPNDKPHPTNVRIKLEEAVKHADGQDFWFGVEQEYTLFSGDRPLGFPKETDYFPEAQGKYYCGVGADRAFGRPLVEKHMQACLKAGLLFDGINAEVMPGQWEYQIGPGKALNVADHLLVARWLLSRMGEEYGITISLNPKPMEGDWNGAGAHTNFSTRGMRDGTEKFEGVIAKLREHHGEHIIVYGKGIEKRLTGKHETCPYTEFRAGVSNRGASIRIPWKCALDKKGYLEDRRPCANMDPYTVFEKIIIAVSGR